MFKLLPSSRGQGPQDRARVRRRLWGLFVLIGLGVLVPALFLAYFGFRSFAYERLIWQRQQEERLTKASDAIHQQLDDSITLWLRNVARSLPTAVNPERGPFLTPDWLKTREVDHQSLQQVFFVSRDGRLRVPDLAHPAQPFDQVDWGSYEPFIATLEHRAFVEKDLPGALEGYERLQRQPLSAARQADLLKRLASGYRKIGRPEEAEQKLLELIRRYGSVPDPLGYPSAVVGMLLLQDLYQATDPDRALQTGFELWDALILSRWSIAESARRRLLAETRGRLDTLMREKTASLPEFQRLAGLEERVERYRANAASWIAPRWPGIQSRLLQRGWQEPGAIFCEAAHCLAVTARPGGWGVAEFDPAQFQESLRQRVVEGARPAGLEVQWASWNGSPSRKGVGREVPRLDPPQQFVLTAPAGDPSGQLVRRRQWAFVGMIIFALALVAGGVFLMIRAIRQEMQISDMKAEFVANVSHELRTPLTAITYIGDRLQTGRYESPQQARRFYTLLGEETQRLRDLIEDILDFSKIMQNKRMYHFEPCDLGMLVEESVQRIRIKADTRRIRIVQHPPANPLVLEADPRAVVQAAMNLLDNAIKYSTEGCEIHVRLAGDARTVSVTVQDSGVGISAENRERIFEKFFRAEEALTRTSEGVGLGLAMVKHIIDAHKGRIDVATEPGQGSAFTLIFPRSPNGTPLDR